MKAGKDTARMARPAPDYPEPVPDLRMRITVERFDAGAEFVHMPDGYKIELLPAESTT